MRKYLKNARILLTTLLAALFLFSSYGSLYASDQWTEFQPLIQESLNRFINQKTPSSVNLDQLQRILKFTTSSSSSGSIDLSRILSKAKEQYVKGDKNSSTALFNYALSRVNTGGDRKQLVNTFAEIGTFFQGKGDNTAAIEYLSRAVDVSLLNNDEAKLPDLLKTLEPLFAWQETQDGIPAGKTTPAGKESRGTSTPSSGGINLPTSIPGVQIPNIQIPNISLPNINIPGGGDMFSILGNILNGGARTPIAPHNLTPISIPKPASTQQVPPLSIPKVGALNRVPVIPIPRYTPEPQPPVTTAPVKAPTASEKPKVIPIPKYTGGSITTPGAIAIPHIEETNRTATVTPPPSSRSIPAGSGIPAANPAKRSQPGRAQKQQGQSTLTIKNIANSRVLPCAGPNAVLWAYEDLDVRSEWFRNYLNPVPGGRYAPYATDTGLDIVAPRGRPLYASKGGVLLYSAPSGHTRQRGPRDDQGAMRVRHPDGTDTFYAHLAGRNASLKPGSKVKQGEWMGNIGTANNVPHLHFTIYYSPNSYEGPYTTPSKLMNPWPAVAYVIQ